MTREEMTGVISIIHTLMANDETHALLLILLKTDHGDKELALTLLRSSFATRDQYQEGWDAQLEYAQTLFGDDAETVLNGLL